MGTNLMRALLLTSASAAMVATVAPTAAYAQEATYQIDIPAQSMGDALRALGKATKQNIVFNGSFVKGKRSAAVRGRMSAGEALDRMLQGSGLKMSRGAGGGLVVAQGGNAAAAPTSDDVSASGSNLIVAPIASASTVVDARTGAALKGALVEIVETGEKTSTGDLGEFRFPGRNGSFNLRISYLGYPEYEQFVEMRDGRASTGILLSDGSADGEIVVTAYQSARAQALNRERSADNVSTVISSDLLGSIPGTTLSESLRRAPAVTFQRDPDTGDGVNIVVRGLEPNLNTIKLNGVELPEASGTQRSASLSNILTESVSQVTIHKTLTVKQDSAGTGALIEIETKTPLDRPASYVSLTAEMAQKGKGFGDDRFVSGVVSFRNSEGTLGVSASAQYRRQKSSRIFQETSLQYGEYLPLQIDGSPAIFTREMINPLLAFPFEPGATTVYPTAITANFDETDSENLSLSLTGSAKLGTHTTLILDFQRLSKDSETYRSQSSLTGSSAYDMLAPGPDGRPRRFLSFDTSMGLTGFDATQYIPEASYVTNVATFRGETNLGKLSAKYSLSYANGRSRSDLRSLVTSTKLPLVMDEILPGAVDPGSGVVRSIFGPASRDALAFPLLTQSGLDRLFSPESHFFQSFSSIDQRGSNSRKAADLALTYHPGLSWLEALDFGTSYEDSRFRNNDSEGVYYYGAITFDPDTFQVLSPSFNDVGLQLSSGSFGPIGIGRTLPVVSKSELARFYRSLQALPILGDTDPDPLYPGISARQFFVDPRLADQGTREQEFAAYAQSTLKFGRLQIVGGVRLSHYNIMSTSLAGPTITNADFTSDQEFFSANNRLETDQLTQTSILPRVLANFRFDDNHVLRLGYYKSIARPQVSLLTQRQEASLSLGNYYGPTFNQPWLNVIRGNPDLKPAETDSFDASFEIYDRNVGAIKLGAFYKRIRNIVESNGVTGDVAIADVAAKLPNDPRFQDVVNNPDDYFISLRFPVNNPYSAEIWGIEASVEHRFKGLPGALSGLGVYANYTYSDSSKTQPFVWSYDPVLSESGAVTGYRSKTVYVKDVPFSGQSKHSGTLGLTYERNGIDANLAYTFQSRRLLRFGANGLSNFEAPFATLDARIEWHTEFGGGRFRFFLEGTDLLRGAADAAIEAEEGSASNRYLTRQTFLGGRQFRLGIGATF